MKVVFSEEKTVEILENIIREASSDESRLSFHDIDSFNDRTCVFRIYGGLNGGGMWKEYFMDLSNLMGRLSATYQSAYVIELKSDPLDDLFEATIGVKF